MRFQGRSIVALMPRPPLRGCTIRAMRRTDQKFKNALNWVEMSNVFLKQDSCGVGMVADITGAPSRLGRRFMSRHVLGIDLG